MICRVIVLFLDSVCVALWFLSSNRRVVASDITPMSRS